jgi:hypothetical protein
MQELVAVSLSELGTSVTDLRLLTGKGPTFAHELREQSKNALFEVGRNLLVCDDFIDDP